jgi:hypothetical protein
MARSETHTDPITIVIADDHRSFGEAMQIALDREQDLPWSRSSAAESSP